MPQLSKNLGDLAYRASRYDEAWEVYNRAVELRAGPGRRRVLQAREHRLQAKRSRAGGAAVGTRLDLNPKHELVKANLDTLGVLP